MDQERIEGIQKCFREAVQALALPSSEQVRVLSPSCITCELYEDFRMFYGPFVRAVQSRLNQRQRMLLEQLADAMEAMPEEAFECFSDEALEHPRWEEIRKSAAEALKALSWPFEAPPAFRETQPGVWRREHPD